MTSPKGSPPTLAQTLTGLIEREPAFLGVDEERVKRDAVDYYDNDMGRCGEFMVSRGTITREQLMLALAKQAEESGEHVTACRHLHKLRDELHSRAISLLGELGDIVGELAGRVS